MVWTRVESAAKSALFRDIPRQNRALKARNCGSAHSAPRGIKIPRATVFRAWVLWTRPASELLGYRPPLTLEAAAAADAIVD